MFFEDFIEQLFTSIKSSNGALTCFVYVNGEELLNTTCLFKDVLSDAVSCADRLSLAIDPVVGQAVRENKSVSLMAVVSFGDNDEVYRFKYSDGELVSNQQYYTRILKNEKKTNKKHIYNFNSKACLNRIIPFNEARLDPNITVEEAEKIHNQLKPFFGF